MNSGITDRATGIWMGRMNSRKEANALITKEDSSARGDAIIKDRKGLRMISRLKPAFYFFLIYN